MPLAQTVKSSAVPELYYDGGEIDVLWDYHDQAIAWYETFLDYFDFWATAEGARITAQGDVHVESSGFVPSHTRIGVRDLKLSCEWYQQFVGMSVQEDRIEDGYLVMTLKENYSETNRSVWILEKLPDGAYTGKIDGLIRPLTLVKDRSAFFAYHQFLQEHGVDCGDVGGYLEKGRVLFHFYDPDGNRFNVSHC